MPGNDLDVLIREGQDRLRGRPATWWERNSWQVRQWGRSALVALLSAGLAVYVGACWYVAYHFVAKYW